MKIKKIKFYNYYGGFGLTNEHPNYEIIITNNKLTYQKTYEFTKFEERIYNNSKIWQTKIKEEEFNKICLLLPSLFRNADLMVCDGDGVVITLTFENNKTQEEHISLTLLDNNAIELNDLLNEMLNGLELPYFLRNYNEED